MQPSAGRGPAARLTCVGGAAALPGLQTGSQRFMGLPANSAEAQGGFLRMPASSRRAALPPPSKRQPGSCTLSPQRTRKPAAHRRCRLGAERTCAGAAPAAPAGGTCWPPAPAAPAPRQGGRGGPVLSRRCGMALRHQRAGSCRGGGHLLRHPQLPHLLRHRLGAGVGVGMAAQREVGQGLVAALRVRGAGRTPGVGWGRAASVPGACSGRLAGQAGMEAGRAALPSRQALSRRQQHRRTPRLPIYLR